MAGDIQVLCSWRCFGFAFVFRLVSSSSDNVRNLSFSFIETIQINHWLDSSQKLKDNSCADNTGLTHQLYNFSIIAQVFIEMRTLWLVEDYVKSCYNHPARGDYNNEELILKMATEEIHKMKENAVFW